MSSPPRASHGLPAVLNTRQFTAQYLGLAAMFVALIALVCVLGPQALDRATARQCETRDWPADRAAATEAWCLDNGYRVGQH